MSALVMGDFGIRFYSVYLIKSLVLGLPMIFCKEQMHMASEYSLMVNFALVLSTVLINVCATSFLTSEKNNPFLEGLND